MRPNTNFFGGTDEYSSILVHFPGNPEIKEIKKKLSGSYFEDSVCFERNGFYIRAWLIDEETLKTKKDSSFPEFIKEKVKGDLETIDSFVNEFVHLAEKNIISDCMSYVRGKRDKGFQMFDYSRTNPKLFDIVKDFEGLSSKDLAGEFSKLPKIAENIHKGEYGMSSVQGKTFKETAERALTIYKNHNVLGRKL